MPIDPATLVAAGSTVANLVGGFVGANRQAVAASRAARLQYKYDMKMLQYQNAYNSPAAQMARYKEAGLNPNLIYNQGNPGNMSQAPSYPEIQIPDYQSIYSGAGSQVVDLAVKARQAKLLETQADLNTVKKDESTVKQELMQAQKDLVKANPYMSPEYINSLISQLQATAKLKQQEAQYMTGTQWYQTDAGEVTLMQRGYRKMDAEIDALFQKLKLGEADAKIKAEILQSKEFQNALQEIQVKWMKDADITPQHIYTGIMLILGKLMTK